MSTKPGAFAARDARPADQRDGVCLITQLVREFDYVPLPENALQLG